MTDDTHPNHDADELSTDNDKSANKNGGTVDENRAIPTRSAFANLHELEVCWDE